MMTAILPIFLLIPLLGFLLSLLVPNKEEKILSWLGFFTAGLQLFLINIFTAYWLIIKQPVLNIKEIVLYKRSGYEFFIDLYFDKITFVFLFVGAILTFLITKYSRDYLHREPGYKRFFNTILFFYLGYNIIVLSGNFETLFIGWEILGISSFLLIAFYRDRYLPVKNAFKVFTLYRIGDVCLILAMWLSHHLWHQNVTFLQLNNYNLVDYQIHNHQAIGITISIFILIPALIKSAQLPFSSWLPRAMEGPTPSSAIFYSSLSVHIGVFLLLRTFHFWEHMMSIRIAIVLMGLSTSIVASFIANVQSSVKAQIAYSSIAQIGLIFIEVALGFNNLALFHFAGNAFLRTYQLLVSPSVVTYLIREQFYSFEKRKYETQKVWLKKIRNTFYVLSLKEWNLETIMYSYMWFPFKFLGQIARFISVKSTILFFIPLLFVGTLMLFSQNSLQSEVLNYSSLFFGFIALIIASRAFVERKRISFTWGLSVFTHFWIILAASFNEKINYNDSTFYLSGIIISGIVGYLCILKLKKVEKKVDLNTFQGHVYEHKNLAFVFLLACLGVSGFPITTTFIGEDLIYNHLGQNQVLLVVLISFSFMINGLSIIRMYARIFLGPHIKTYHEVAERSA